MSFVILDAIRIGWRFQIKELLVFRMTGWLFLGAITRIRNGLQSWSFGVYPPFFVACIA
jgi:hypothetical protein